MSRRLAVALLLCVALAGLLFAGRWYGTQHAPAGPLDAELAVSVSSAEDSGPGTLREALFVVATAKSPARIVIEVPRIALQSTLPPIVNGRGVRIVGRKGGTEVNARALGGGPVFDVAAEGVSLEGLLLRECPEAGVLLRASRFRLVSSAIESCDVGVDVAESATDMLLEQNRFAGNRIGVRSAAASAHSVIAANVFTRSRDAGVWAVRSSLAASRDPLTVRANRFEQSRAGIVTGNVAIRIESNDFLAAQDAAVHLVGAGAVVRTNRISGGTGMGIIAEGARDAVIEGNELEGLPGYGVLVRGSSNVVVRSNRVHNCAYGLAFVLNDARNPSSALENTILEPRFNGIDVVGDSPILRRNQVVHPRAYPLHVQDFQPPGGATVHATPLLEANSFGAAADTARLR